MRDAEQRAANAMVQVGASVLISYVHKIKNSAGHRTFIKVHVYGKLYSSNV